MQKKFRQWWGRLKSVAMGRWAVLLCLLTVLCIGGYFGRTYFALVRAEGWMAEKGFMVLAAEELHPYRETLCRTHRGCRALLQAYFEGRYLDRAEWAGQACLAFGQEIPEAYVALAGVREATGREEEALNILRAANQKFKDDPSILYRLAKLLGKAGQPNEAKSFLVQAADRVPKNTNVQIETLIFLLQAHDYPTARTIADRLRSNDQRELNALARLLIAQVYFKQGDAGSARVLVQQAVTEWKKLAPAQQEKIQKIAAEAVRELRALAG